MSRLTLVLAVLVVILAACGTTAAPADPSPTPSPSASPSGSPTPASPVPTDPVPATPGPVVTPVATDPPAPTKPTADEQYLLDGVRDDVIYCRPVRDDLPPDALAGIECESNDPAVARIGFYLFSNDDLMLDAYFARIRAEGLEPDSGPCTDGEGEAAYIPGEEEIAYRQACFVNDEGYANYRATVPGSVYLGLLGRSKDMRALEDVAWRGNQDVPGFPTLWREPQA